MRPHRGEPMSQQRAPRSPTLSQWGWVKECAGAQLAGLACLLFPGCEGSTVPHPTSLLHPITCVLSCFFPFFICVTLNSRDVTHQEDICVRSHLSLQNLGVSPMYHDGVLYGLSLLNSFFLICIIKNKTKQIFASSTELREWLREKHPAAISSF